MATISNISQLDPNAIYTYSDYLKWQFDEMVELIKGKVFSMSPAPRTKHQLVSANLFFEIFSYFRKKKCRVFEAPFDVRLANSKERKDKTGKIYSVVQPDICVICDETKLDEYGCNGSPDWVIEIASTSTIKRDFNDKFNLYQESGVKEYWIILPDSHVVHTYFLIDQVYQLQGIHEKTGIIPSSLYPDFSVMTEDIFA